MTEPELSEIWTRKCLLLEPNSSFEKKESISGKKKRWALDLIQRDFGLLGTSVATGLAIAILGMVMAVFSQKLVDDVLPSHNATKLVAGIILVLILGLAKVFISALRSRLLITQSKDHIILFVTQRLETARSLGDNIVVMEKGQITAQGTHASLLQSDNFYSEYWKSLMA